MSLPQSPPGRGGRRPHVHWVYIPTAPGKTWHAWIAGSCHWFLCHTKGKTKPCLHALTGGELTCDKCSPFEVGQVVGYQPLYRETDARPCMVIVHEYTRELMDKFRLHSRVAVGRGEGSTDGVWVNTALKHEPFFRSSLPERNQPADLTETLLRVWAIPELTEWYRQTHGRSDNAVSQPLPAPAPPAVTPPPVIDREVKGPLARLAEAEERQKREEAEEELKIGGVMNHLLGKAANGKPPFKKK